MTLIVWLSFLKNSMQNDEKGQKVSMDTTVHMQNSLPFLLKLISVGSHVPVCRFMPSKNFTLLIFFCLFSCMR